MNNLPSMYKVYELTMAGLFSQTLTFRRAYLWRKFSTSLHSQP